MKKSIAFLVSLLLFMGQMSLDAQTSVRKDIRSGNRAYNNGNYDTACDFYRKALKSQPANAVALYNMGNSLLRQRDAEKAVAQYENAAKAVRNPLYKAQIHHNLGVVFQSQKQYAQAIDHYKEALRSNPDDDQTRYNLALCKKLMKNQPQKGGGGNDQKKQQQQSPQKQKQSESEDLKSQQQENQKSSISKDNAERLLELSKMEEQETQRRIKNNQYRAKPRQREKNW